MEAQHLQLHVFAHRRGHVGVDDAHDRHAAGQLGIGEEMVDPGAQRDDELQVGEGGEEARRRPPDQRRLDLGGIAEVRPDAELGRRRRFRERGAPFRGGIDAGTKEEGHCRPS